MVKSSDVILILVEWSFTSRRVTWILKVYLQVSILFPPAAAAIVTGCSCDLLINILLTWYAVSRIFPHKLSLDLTVVTLDLQFGLSPRSHSRLLAHLQENSSRGVLWEWRICLYVLSFLFVALTPCSLWSVVQTLVMEHINLSTRPQIPINLPHLMVRRISNGRDSPSIVPQCIPGRLIRLVWTFSLFSISALRLRFTLVWQLFSTWC